MNCDEATRLLMDFDQLSETQRINLEGHAQTCAACGEKLLSLQSMTNLTRPLKSVDVSFGDPAGFVEGILKALPKEGKPGRRGWMPRLDGMQASPWLAAASLFLAGLFIYEQFPAGEVPMEGAPLKGTVLNARMYRQELNKIRDTQSYKNTLLCRSPYRKLEQTAACIRQKFIKTSSL